MPAPNQKDCAHKWVVVEIDPYEGREIGWLCALCGAIKQSGLASTRGDLAR